MTVLHRNTAAGLGQRGKQVMVGFAIVAVGIGAAFGLSQLVDSGGGTAHQVLSERDAAMQANVDTIVEGGRAQAKALNEAAAVRERTEAGAAYGTALESAAATRAAASEWTLEDELNALHQERNVLSDVPAVQPSGVR